ncbi:MULTISPECIES: CapA family protein [Nocardiopsis]|uniref:Poly-gamma-glutamate biosynthesis protein n=1 Tax=Nocardiopsis sinuspersici TaxID=501010 RepID=A0A1V3C5E3_9ACTN|nr:MULTISPECIES: CapA family protein [Nocardiopsis]NYH52541.1 poly-gamma-glutamate synthesis protein (capsule biosynthesis protein) [Nocardiopsis sinuspersici]OOC56014.1 poly-gamma-glutamate biosynthesis protein [Nocardiopsis sinuspersici]
MHPVSPRPRTRTTLSVGAATLILLLAACSAGEEAPSQNEGAAAPSDEATTPASPSPSTEPEPAGEPFTVAFGGDVMFEGVLEPRLADPQTALGPVAEQLSAADLAMVNLETAVTEGGTPAPGKAYTFRAPASSLEALEAAGVDVATVANNHGMDYGVEGLKDTLENGEASPVQLVGAGLDIEEAYKPHVAEVNGQSVAMFGAADVLDDHLIDAWTAGEGKPGMASTKGEMKQRMITAVSEAAAEYDNVVVFLHWGLEGAHCPLPHAPTLAEELVAAGASAVVGGHAHVLSPGGFMDDSYVHYGLGNFVFYNFDGPTAETGVLTLTFDQGGVTQADWAPAQIQGGVPVPYEGAAAEKAEQTWLDMRAECGLPLTDSPA